MGIIAELIACFTPAHEAFVFMWLLAAMGVTAFFVAGERWLVINRRTDYDAGALFDKLKTLIDQKKLDDAFALCCAGNQRALPRILGAGIQKAQTLPQMVSSAMSEELIHATTALERRLNYLVMFGNSSTLLGLLGTVFGLIMSFAAVGKPGVAAVEKSSLLAAGISAAMNSTLVGLGVSVTCVLIYAFLRARVDGALVEIDRYAVALYKHLVPADTEQSGHQGTLRRRGGEDEIPDTDVTPMLNLMVILIPFLLTSSEFVKIGAIELKLPESSQGAGSGAGQAPALQNVKLDLGIVITKKGFSLYHYFKQEPPGGAAAAAAAEIPLVNDQYDYAALNAKLADIKKRALETILKSYFGQVPPGASLYQLARAYSGKNLAENTVLADHENIKIVAEESVKYQVVVAVMDASRGTQTPDGSVTMFPNVAIAGGVVQ
ncbi:MAG: MotA/TolQ/ExbB proton channel family protein [Chitinivibrionales bacterium]|nr:MotA/TolQ/ExbB proton channel family protein [Chitinivibrionales bacterium]